MNAPIKRPQIDEKELVKREAMRIIEDGDRIARDLLADTSEERRKYPESEFRQIFLPVITGAALKNLPPGYTVQRVLDEARNCWRMVAGGDGSEVDVVNRDGSVAFTMPALTDSAALDTIQKSGNENIKYIEEDFRQQQGLGAIASRNLVAGLNKRLAAMASRQPDTKEAGRKIDAMRKFYGLETKSEAAQVEDNGGNNSFMGEMSFG